jgi:hypothetical protein
MSTTTPNFGLFLPAAGDVGWATAINNNFTTIDANLTNALPRAYLAGCQLTVNAGAPTTKIDLSAGQAQDIGNAGAMTLAATLTKDLTATWAVGTGNGGLAPTLTLAVATWYHVFVIKRTDTNVTDAMFDTSVTAAHIPAPYTLFRRVGSILTDAATLILPFTQDGDYFEWTDTFLEATSATPGTNAVTQTLTRVPTGVSVRAVLNATNAASMFAYISPLTTTDIAPSATVAPLSNAGTSGASTGGNQLMVRTNTSAQIRTRNSANARLFLATIGWYDRRGRDG